MGACSWATLFSSISICRRPKDGPHNWRLGKIDIVIFIIIGKTVGGWHGTDEQAGVSDFLVLAEEDASTGTCISSDTRRRSSSAVGTSCTSRSKQQHPIL